MSNAKKQSAGVGYGKPPIHSRFQKGRSGNPSGRPKRRTAFKSVNSLVQEFLNREISVVQNGRKKTIRLVEAVLARLGKSALEEGNTQAIKLMLSLANEHLPAHESLSDWMNGRPLFEFTPGDVERFNKSKLIEEMQLREQEEAASDGREGDRKLDGDGDGEGETVVDPDDDEKQIL